MENIRRVSIIVILITIITYGIVGCAEKGKEVEVKEIPGVPPGYFEKWEYFAVDSEVVKEKAKAFFGGREYKAIWKWDTDGDGKIEYLLVELHPKIVKGIKGGILIGEDGEVKLIIDRNKGIYTPEYMIDDFKRDGIREGEVGCIRFLYYKDKNRGESVIFTKKEREKIERPQQIGIMWYSLIDKDLKLIGGKGECWIYKGYNKREEKVFYELYDFGAGDTEERYYNRMKKFIEKYRLNKSKGIVFDPVNFNPENPEEVSNYIKSLKEEK